MRVWEWEIDETLIEKNKAEDSNSINTADTERRWGWGKHMEWIATDIVTNIEKTRQRLTNID